MRLIDPEGRQLGIFPLYKALQKASDYNLDLVEVAPNAVPPVCKIMDYGKYRFQQTKKVGKQKTISLKEIKLRPMIGNHDLDMKIKNIRKFIEDGDRVKLTMFFRGREILHPENAYKVFDKIKDNISDIANIETGPTLEGKRMLMIIVPKGG